MRTVLLPMLPLLLCVAAAPAVEPKFAAKYEKLAPPAAVAAPIRKLLGEQALIIRGGADDAVMRVWFRSEIPIKANAEQVKNGLTYREIPETTVIGAIEFPRAFTDFRKQQIPAGTYTLRFAIQPDTGDHTGTAPHTEFCLMSPADKDRAAEPMEVKALIEMSAEINEGKHPAVLLLFPNFTKDAGPTIVDKGGGVWVVTLRRPVNTGDVKATLGFGITIAGVTKQ